MACKLDHLLDALHKNNADSVRLCLMDGYPVGQKTKHSGNTALHHAAAVENPVFLQMMVQAGGLVEVNTTNSLLRTPFHVAANDGNAPAALVLVENGANAQAKDRDGKTPKMLAIEAGHTEMSALVDSLLAAKQIDALLTQSKSINQKKAGSP
jgi:ankyrin repeat protein